MPKFLQTFSPSQHVLVSKITIHNHFQYPTILFIWSFWVRTDFWAICGTHDSLTLAGTLVNWLPWCCRLLLFWDGKMCSGTIFLDCFIHKSLLSWTEIQRTKVATYQSYSKMCNSLVPRKQLCLKAVSQQNIFLFAKLCISNNLHCPGQLKLRTLCHPVAISIMHSQMKASIAVDASR